MAFKKWRLLIFVVLAVAFFLIYKERLVHYEDYTRLSHQIDQKVNQKIREMGLEESGLLSLVREEKQENEKIWIQVTKEIELDSSSGKRLPGILQKGLEEYGVQVFISEPEKKNLLEITVRKGDLLFQTLLIHLKQAKRLCIVIDDLGYSRGRIEELMELGIPLTFAVLPRLSLSRKLAGEITGRGYQLILHQPMEPLDSTKRPGPGVLLVTMDKKEVIKRLEENLATVPGAVGVNNHMGSRFTTDREKMQEFLLVLKKKNLFYLDSRTTSRTVGYALARELKVKSAINRVFLDLKKEDSFIEGQMEKVYRLLRKNDNVVAIGHIYNQTLVTVLSRWIPRFRKEGIELVFLSEIVE